MANLLVLMSNVHVGRGIFAVERLFYRK